MTEYILVGGIVLLCLVYTVRKIVGILRGRDTDGCAFCSGGTPTGKGGNPCAGCAHISSCTKDEKEDEEA